MNRDDKLILCVGICVLDVIHVCKEYPNEDSDRRLVFVLVFKLFFLCGLFGFEIIWKEKKHWILIAANDRYDNNKNKYTQFQFN